MVSFVVLELARHDVVLTRFQVGQTPVVLYETPEADGPIVVVAHGFSGSEQIMQGYALPLARAGYRVFAFDFLGHGRNTQPMSGDVSSVDGTTRLLVEQTAQVIDAVAQGAGDVALLGHAMASDVLVRVTESRADVGPVVLISAFSNQIDAQNPDNLLLVSGAWEPGLRAFALKSVQSVDADAKEGDMALRGPVTRRAVVAPFAEHVSVLHSRVARGAALAWLNRAYMRSSDVTILPTGWAILGLLAGLVIVFRPLCALLPQLAMQDYALNFRQTAVVLLLPMVVAPIVARAFNTDFLPVLVADYLALHMLVFGAVQLALLRFWRVPLGSVVWPAIGVLLLACAVFGLALDRYAANFWPTGGRFWIILAMMIGAVPYMVADAVVTLPQSARGRFCTRVSFLVSLGIAVALVFEGHFFLILIAPVMILFYLVFGTMGRATGLRASPLSAGLALGVVLAWALGVSFPLFQA